MLQILPLTADEIPVSKNFLLNGESYEFRFQYNKRFDFITLEIWDGEEFLFSSKLCYGHNTLTGFGKIPFAIVPLIEKDLYVKDFSGVSVNLETIGKSVHLYFEDNV